MLIPLLLLSILESLHSSCPPGFDLVRDGECRGFYGTIVAKTEEDGYSENARSLVAAKCAEIHGKPVIIHDEEHQDYWHPRAAQSLNPLLLGLICVDPLPGVTTRPGIKKPWQWTDGSPLDYAPIADIMGQGLLAQECDENMEKCSYRMEKDGYWNNPCRVYKKNVTFDVYCTTQLQQPILSGCNDFEVENDDGVCYRVDATAESFKDAQKVCGDLGANLASIHNPEENSFIRRLAVSNGAVNGVFLGATMSGKGNQFGWIDGSEWDYNNFYPGFPVDGRGDCLAMDTLSTSGQWMNINCSSQLAVACARETNVNNACSGGPWKEGQTISSPGYPYSASIPCDYFLSVEAGKRVQVEVMLLEANSCCDRLILTDDILGGNIVANLTGEVSGKTYTTSSSNLMRVSWQPNGGVNVRGMMITFRGV